MTLDLLEKTNGDKAQLGIIFFWNKSYYVLLPCELYMVSLKFILPKPN